MLWILEISEGSYWHLSVMLSGRSQMSCLSTSCSMVPTTICVTIFLQVIGEWGVKVFHLKTFGGVNEHSEVVFSIDCEEHNGIHFYPAVEVDSEILRSAT